eukprot:scaffold303_cov410-Prasinococcus_capsulatus_cf.AAC.16
MVDRESVGGPAPAQQELQPRHRGTPALRCEHPKQRLRCPGCLCYITPQKMRQHLGMCCPDVLEELLANPEFARGKWTGDGNEAFDWKRVEAEGARIEETRTGAVSDLMFFSDLSELDFEERQSRVAERAGLPLQRVQWLCKKLSKAQELPFRNEPPFAEGEVLLEDEHILVVNKRAGLKAQPRHRWEGRPLGWRSRCAERSLTRLHASPLCRRKLD